VPVIAVTFDLPPAAADLLTQSATVIGPEGWRDALPEAGALLCLLTDPIDANLLNRAPHLRIVANAAVGFNNVDVAACHERGIVVTNTPDVLTEATADLTWALILCTVRRVPQAERSLRAGEFAGWGMWDYLGGDLQGATLGIFGMGRIGQATARRAAPFGMHVRYTNRSLVDVPYERVAWETLLTTSDILSLHAPLTPETHHLLSQAEFQRMKPGSYLINTARGALVDGAALVSALRNGPLAGAGLDVYEHEPNLAPGLLELENAVLLPHIGSATRATRNAMAMLAARNVAAVLSGDPPLTPVRR
jgi:glyoxylate reductase